MSMDKLMELSYRYSSFDRDDTGLLYRSDFEDKLLWTAEEIDGAFESEEEGMGEEDDDDNIAAELSAFLFDLTMSTEELVRDSLPSRLHSVDYKELLLNLSFDANVERGWAKALSVIHGEPLWHPWVEDKSLSVEFKNK